jgi:myo-inositol-1(or 4)-monophosphatase
MENISCPFGTLAFAKDLAEKVGRMQMAHFRKKFTVALKGKRDPVTSVDIRSEKMIIGAIRQKYPAHGFLAEEGDDCKADFLWVIDPLDGTVNYARGIPCFSISIALTYQLKPILGIVYDPCLKQMFWAEKGKGSFLNGRRISVSEKTLLKDSFITTGFPYKLESVLNPLLALLKYLIKNTFAVRRMGSAALDLAYVAAGFTEGHIEYFLKPWDVAAGILIVEEAGGKITLPQNSIFLVMKGITIASNGKVHPFLLKIAGKG